MIITILEGKVPDKFAKSLQKKYAESVKKVPPEIIKTYLTQSKTEPEIWKIITVWKSMEDIEEMRKLGTPTGVLIFRSVGCEPVLSLHEIKEQSL